MNWTQTQEMNFGLLTARNEAIPLEGVSVHGHITGRSVKVTVAQTYRNTESVPVEAIYKFPLPDESAVCGFRIIKDGSTLTGVMEERDEAFRKYDEAAGIASIESPSHSVRYFHGEKAITVEFTSEAVPMDRDFILNIHYKELSTTRAYLFAEGDAVYVQLDYMQPKAEGTAVSGEGREVVFVIDRSGSVEGPSIEQAKRYWSWRRNIP